jgi:cytidylate kinase
VSAPAEASFTPGRTGDNGDVTLITLSAPYGAGGSQVGPAVARRCGVPFLDRAIPTRVAAELAVPLQEALARDEAVGISLARMTVWLSHVGQAFGAPAALTEEAEEVAYRTATEKAILELAEGDGAVILGRGAAAVLRGDPRAFHVRLDGPVDARIRQGMQVEGVDRETAERHVTETDRAREAYVQHFYRVDPRDAALYHLVIDSTAIPLDACSEIIVAAARAREAAQGQP